MPDSNKPTDVSQPTPPASADPHPSREAEDRENAYDPGPAPDHPEDHDPRVEQLRKDSPGSPA